MKNKFLFPNRICIVSHLIPPNYSGAGLAAFNYAIRLFKSNKLGYLITRSIISYDDCSKYEKDINFFNKIIILQKNNVFLNIYKNRFIKRLLPFILDNFGLMFKTFIFLIKKRKNIDIIHCFSPNWFTFFIVLFGKIFKKKVIVEITLLGQDDPATVTKYDFLRIKKMLRLFQLKLADALIPISPAIYEICIKSGIKKNKLFIINRSIDTNVFCKVNSETKNYLRKKYIDTESFIVLFVGSLIIRKGADLLFPIFFELNKLISNSILLIIGNMNSEESVIIKKNMINEAKKIGLDNKIFFKDPVININEYMQLSDIFLFPSRKEGFPNVVIQAMACGLPVFSSLIVGINNFIITNKQNGFILENEDPKAFAELIKNLTTDKNLYESISYNANSKVKQTFTNEIVDLEYNNLYTKLFC